MDDEPPPFRSAFSDAIAEEWEDEYKYPQGMLTDTDRRFLWGLKEYKHESTVSERRGDIKRRVVCGLRDLSYLSRLTDRMRGDVFDDLEEQAHPGDLRSSIASLIEFLYLGLDGDQEWIEETISHGISNAEAERAGDDETYYAGSAVDAGVDVDIEVTRGYDVNEIEERFRAGKERTLTPAEIGVLVREGRVEPEELAVLDSNRRERFDPDSGEIEDPGPNPLLEPPMPEGGKPEAPSPDVEEIDPSEFDSGE